MKNINLTLKVWRQKDSKSKGKLETYQAKDISVDMSFLEMIDVVNEEIVLDGGDAIAFDHDCREGICGMCGCVVNGRAHGPEAGTTLCQLHMRHFDDKDVVVIEPWRSKAFKVLKDLVTDRSALDEVIQVYENAFHGWEFCGGGIEFTGNMFFAVFEEDVVIQGIAIFAIFADAR